MAKALLQVESRPTSADQVDEYHSWHESTDIPEMLSVDGFVSARRWRADDGASFITLCEIDTDIDTARAHPKAALQAGQISRPVAVQTQPPPVQRYLTFVGGTSA